MVDNVRTVMRVRPARAAGPPPAVGVGTLRRLATLQPVGAPVLSVYLSLGPAAVSACDAQLVGLAVGCPPRLDPAAIGRVRETLRSLPALAHGTRGIAAFFSADGATLELVALPVRVGAMAVLDTQPWLEPLAGAFSPGDSGVVIVGPHRVRLLRGDARGLVEFALVRDEPQAGNIYAHISTSRGQVLTEDGLPAVVRRAAALMLRAHRRLAFDKLAVAAPGELWPFIADALDADLRRRLVGFVERDLWRAPTATAARVFAPIIGPMLGHPADPTYTATAAPCMR